METIKGVEQRKSDIAQAAGVDLDKVSQVRFDISRMLDNGILVDIDLHGFSCLKSGVRWEELGIPADDDRRNRMSAGVKYLAPAEFVKRLQSLETRYRQCLDRYSFDATSFKPWRWLPFTAYDEWKAEWVALNADLESLKADFVANYDAIKADNTAYFTGVARRAWESYNLHGGDAIEVKSRIFSAYADFEKYIVEQALAGLPTAEQFQYGVYAEYHTGYLVTPPELRTLRSLEEAAQANASAADAAARLAWQAEREKDIELTEKQIQARVKAEAVRQAEIEHARQQLAQITSPLGEIVTQFRSRIYECVVSAAESIRKNGHLRGKTAEMLSGLSALYNTLASSTGDSELETALISLDAALGAVNIEGKGKYNLESVETALRAVTEITEAASEDAARQGVAKFTRAGALEL